MKRAKAAVAVLLFALLLFCPRGAVPTEDPPAVEYVSIYPVQPDDPEWAAFTSASEMLAACRVPAEVIRRALDAAAGGGGVGLSDADLHPTV